MSNAELHNTDTEEDTTMIGQDVNGHEVKMPKWLWALILGAAAWMTHQAYTSAMTSNGVSNIQKDIEILALEIDKHDEAIKKLQLDGALRVGDHERLTNVDGQIQAVRSQLIRLEIDLERLKTERTKITP